MEVSFMLSNKMLALKYSLLGSAMLTMAGCSSMPRQALPFQQTSDPDGKQKKAEKAVSQQHKTTLQKPQVAAIPTTQDASKPATTLDKVAFCALRQRGTQYCWGGNTPMKGFDCSGLTQYSFQQGAGVNIPRTAAAQYAAAVKVPQEQAQKGDLVFFRTRGKKVSHVGLYLGRNQFVHAPRAGKSITTSKLEGYWKKRLVGFGRIPGACRPLVPSATA